MGAKNTKGHKEYTPAQRRVIDARLAKGLADIKAGRIRGPFTSAAEMITDMKSRLRKRGRGKRTQ